MYILEDYLDGIIPHIPEIKLQIVKSEEGLIHRFDNKTKIETWVISVNGYDLAKAYKKVDEKIFASNIRGFQGETKINRSISHTVSNEPNNFWYFNNGITIVCDDAKRETKNGEDYIIINKAQIINGQQTTIALNLKEDQSKQTHLLVKIIKIPREQNDHEKTKVLINSIVKATNWQNAITTSDLTSNDPKQIHLQKEFRKNGYLYLRKKMSNSEAKNRTGQGFIVIKKTELAKAVAACIEDPQLVRKGKEHLFEEENYEKIFKSNSISFYLSKYWLMKEVGRISAGYPRRAYAKWIALNFIWNKLNYDIDKKTCALNFRKICESKNKKRLEPLHRAITIVFNGINRFYQLNKGSGAEAIDVSSFFRKTNLHIEFGEFWNKNLINEKTQLEKYIEKFIKSLWEFDDEKE